jgi:hypothetical protein
MQTMQSIRRAIKRAVDSPTDNIATASADHNQNDNPTTRKRMKGSSSTSLSQPVSQADKYSEMFDAVLAKTRAETSVNTTNWITSESDEQRECSHECSRRYELIINMLDCQRQMINEMNSKLDDVHSFLNSNYNLNLLANKEPPQPQPSEMSNEPLNITSNTALSVPAAPSTHSNYQGQVMSKKKNQNVTQTQHSSSNSSNRYFQHSSTRSDVNESNKRQNEDADYHTTMIIHRTLRDTARRRCNIIVSGLPEECNCEVDRMSFLGICDEWLPIKPILPEGSCIRIGKQIQTGIPRRLLVRTGSEEIANSLLKAAPLLRQAADVDVSERIFINPDLAPEAARLAYEQRKARRATRGTKQSQYPQPPSHPTSRVKNVNIDTQSSAPSPTTTREVQNIESKHNMAALHSDHSDFQPDSEIETITDNSPSITLSTEQPIHLRYTSCQTAPSLNVPHELNENTITVTAEVHNNPINDGVDEYPPAEVLQTE